MQQLTPQDAVFIGMETEEHPSHIGGVALLDPGDAEDFGFDRFVDFIRERLGACERFSWRLQEVPFGLDRPYWVEASDFDAADHVRRIAVPSPFCQREFGDLLGLLYERPLDRDRPLWEMFLIEGLPGARVALLWKVHHCLMDGSSGSSLTEQLFDLDAHATRPQAPEIVDRAVAGSDVPASRMWQRALQNAAELPAKQSRYVGAAIKSLLRRREREEGEREEDPRRDAAIPHATFNGRVGKRRGISWSSVSLDEVKRLKNDFSVTVNDVVLAITSGAIRSYLHDRDALPGDSLVASVPMSLRSADDNSLGNQVREMPVRWSTDIADPIERLLEIHGDASEAKRAARESDSFNYMGMMAEALLPGALQLVIRGASTASESIPLVGNAVVSNVPMTPFPLYIAGARVESMVPISLLGPTQGLNITVLSYCGELHFGLSHDPELVPDAWSLADQIPKAFQALQAAADRNLGDPGL